jgi:transcriptional regulator with GAF, ATPase, and Fis domain
VPIDPDALADSVARLEDVDPADAGLDEALDLVAREADDLFPVDGAGIMLLSEGSVLRYVAASDEPGQLLEALQEQAREGPCVDAFYHDRPVITPDLAVDRRWPSIGPQASRHGIRAVLGVPIGLRKGPVGTLNVYAAAPHAFDEEDLAAIQAYARVVASLLRAGVQAHVRGRAATQLRYALNHRVLIEQAKGVVMERHKLDEKGAFELLRRHARSTRMPLDKVALEVIAGGRLTR